ncbi:hypothetical protein HK097_003731, partial [Rhizophlyctis rosea]
MKKLSIRRSSASTPTPDNPQSPSTPAPQTPDRTSISSAHAPALTSTSQPPATGGGAGSRFSLTFRRRSDSIKSSASSIHSVDSSLSQSRDQSGSFARSGSQTNLPNHGGSHVGGGIGSLGEGTTFLDLTPASVKSSVGNVNPKKLNSLQEAVYKADLKKVQQLMGEKKRDVNKLDSYHRFTALHVAAEHNREEAARLLLGGVQSKEGGSGGKETLKRANPNMTNADGRTPLMLAVIMGHTNLVRLLLDYGASVDITDVLDCAALHYTLLNRDAVSFNLIMAKNPKLNGVDKSGYPLLHHAIRLGNIDMATDLINKGHYVNAVNSENQTPLHLLLCTPSSPTPSLILTRLLLQKGADPTLRDSHSKKPIEYLSATPENQELTDLLTLKELAKEAREVIVRRDFLAGSGDELRDVGAERKVEGMEETTKVESFVAEKRDGLGIEYGEREREKKVQSRTKPTAEVENDEAAGDDSPLDLSLDLSSDSDSEADTNSEMLASLGLPRKEKKLKKRKSIIRDRDTSSLEDISERDLYGRTESELSIDVGDVEEEEENGERVEKEEGLDEARREKAGPSSVKNQYTKLQESSDDVESDILSALSDSENEEGTSSNLLIPKTTIPLKSAPTPTSRLKVAETSPEPEDYSSDSVVSSARPSVGNAFSVGGGVGGLRPISVVHGDDEVGIRAFAADISLESGIAESTGSVGKIPDAGSTARPSPPPKDITSTPPPPQPIPRTRRSKRPSRPR